MSDWVAPPGTKKLRCEDCRKDFASRGGAVCPDCVLRRKRYGRRPNYEDEGYSLFSQHEGGNKRRAKIFSDGEPR